MSGEFDDVDFTKEFDDVDFTTKKQKPKQSAKIETIDFEINGLPDPKNILDGSQPKDNFLEGQGALNNNSPSVSDELSLAISEYNPPNPRENFRLGLIQGTKEAAQGVVQLITSGGEKVGLLTEEDLLRTTRRIQKQRNEFNKTESAKSGSGKFGRFVGGTAPFMLLPGGQANTLRGLVTKGATSSGLIGATQFVPEEELDNNGRLKNTLLGAVIGGSTPLGIAGISKVFRKTANTIKGKVSPENEELINLSKKHDIPLSFGDITKKPKVQGTEIHMEKIPLLGSSGFRANQADKTVESAERFKRFFENQVSGSDDVGHTIQNSLIGTLKKRRDKAGELYSKVAAIADNAGDVKTTSLNNTAKILIDKIQSKGALTSRDKKLITILSRYKQTEGKTFSQIRQMRSDISDDISIIKRTEGQKGINELIKAKEAVERDLENFANEKGGQILQRWKEADKFYREKVVPIKTNKPLMKAIDSDEPDQIYHTFIKQGKGDKARNFFNSLDDNGRSAVRLGMIEEAMGKATSNTISPTKGTPQFSVDRFLTQLQRVQKSRGIFFKGQNKEELNGFMKLLDHSRRSGRFAENPPTGNRLTGIILAGTAAVSPNTGATIGMGLLGSGVMKFLFLTKPGKRILLSSSKAKNPDQFNKILEKINQTVGRSTVVEATNED